MKDALGIEDSQIYAGALSAALSSGFEFSKALAHLLNLLSRPLINASLILFNLSKPHVTNFISNLLEYERNLSNEMKAFQLLLLTLAIICAALKRYIARKRYVERLAAWLTKRRSEVKTSYDEAMQKVRDFNYTLACVLPHLIYVGVCVGCWRWFKPQVAWLASGWTVPVLSVVYPVFGTVAVLRQRSVLKGGVKVPDQVDVNVKSPKDADKSSPNTPPTTKSSSSTSSTSFASPLSSPILRVGGGKRTKSLGCVPLAQKSESDSDVVAAIRYWTVYGVVTASYTFLSYLPFLNSHVIRLQSLSGPLKFFFFLWLHLPFDATEMIYRYACPLALRFADKSGGKVDNDAMMNVINKLTSLIGLAAMVGLCGDKTRDRANIVLRESLSVLPSVVCLGMPSYFTSFGVIWSSLLVPAANSARGNANFEAEVEGAEESQTRWLKYWCVYATTSGALHYLNPILAWVPFSTHGVLVLFMAMSLPGLGVCEFLFQIIVNEAVGWGILSGEGFKDVGETMVVRGIRAVSRAEKMRSTGGDDKGAEKEGKEEPLENKKNK
ncbi:hypothetical protein TrVE_jg5279 [Triparma verrucosa]|uniref:Uncharacterized protein n=1 Tax=Triparma verrucosa TaxID=1606542 RepID=A0A9W7KXU6_9STRA|nr:hypothetical protein TrVE_jg5279 [Triparma verrucosa]